MLHTDFLSFSTLLSKVVLQGKIIWAFQSFVDTLIFWNLAILLCEKNFDSIIFIFRIPVIFQNLLIF